MSKAHTQWYPQMLFLLMACAQLHAPLLDLNSPFDDNLMLTADIAEEAKRLMMNLEGMWTWEAGCILLSAWVVIPDCLDQASKHVLFIRFPP
jgi:hypothetical protein